MLCLISDNPTLLIYIAEKFPLVIPSKRRKILVKKTLTSFHETKTGILIFCVDVHMGLDPPSTCVHLSLTPPPPCGRHKWMASKAAAQNYPLPQHGYKG